MDIEFERAKAFIDAYRLIMSWPKINNTSLHNTINLIDTTNLIIKQIETFTDVSNPVILKKFSTNIINLLGICGIYFLMKDELIDYIGKSVNIGIRLSHHHIFNNNYHNLLFVYEYPYSHKDNLPNIEKNLILILKPKKNKTHNTNY
jgi:hypothetical protein